VEKYRNSRATEGESIYISQNTLNMVWLCMLFFIF